MIGLSFIIPIKIDSEDRVYNIKTIVEHLASIIGKNIEIIIIEQVNSLEKYQTKLKHIFNNYTSQNNLKILSIPSQDNLFYKSKLINTGILNSTYDIVAVYDADVLISKKQLMEAFVNVLKTKNPTHPFNKYLINIPKADDPEFPNCRDLFLKAFKAEYEQIYMNYPKLIEKNYVSMTPPGGCVLFHKDDIINIGLYNEEFKSYGPEDKEIIHRYKWLGRQVDSVEGYIYHLDHSRTENSCCPVLAQRYNSNVNPNYDQNMKLYDKLKSMEVEQLKEYYQIS